MQGESHALFALAQLVAAIDIEQLHIAHTGAGLVDLLDDIAAGDLLVGYQSQVALDGVELGDGLVAEVRVHLLHHSHIVDLAQEDLLVILAVLGQLELGGNVVGQLAEAADALAVAQDMGGDAGMQPGYIVGALIVEGQAEGTAQHLHGALEAEEVLVVTEGREAQVQAFLRQLGDGELPRNIDVGQLEQTALMVAALEVLHCHIEQGRRQQGAHDGQVGADGVEDANDLALGRIGGNVQSINNFDTVKFENLDWQDNEIIMDIADGEHSKLNASHVEADHIHFNDSKDIDINDEITLIKADDDKLDVNASEIRSGGFTAGVAAEGDGEAVMENGQLVYKITGLHTAKQTKLVAENRAVAAVFVNQGTDLISDSLDALSRDGSYGVKTFAAVHGNAGKYDVNSDIKINGWSTIAGVGNAAQFNSGDEFSWGVFYENGNGNYRTYNSFNDEFFRGDGSLVYNGGGAAARYQNAHGVYTEASLRAGMLKSEMSNALSDGTDTYGYESDANYYGAHIGVGQIIPLGKGSSLDVYGKFFHTYTEGDSFSIAGDEFSFDGVASDRLRIGARVNANEADKFSAYYGLAYEYEFNGDAKMRAAGLDAPEQSLKGSSYMAEAGVNYKPSPESPWSLDLNVRGYAGEREGASVSLQASYAF